jgi:glyoxylase-like metal-dependent hydrolase (beta-lactamase superfamily II)
VAPMAGTLIDTGMHTGDSAAAFRAALEEVGLAPTDIHRIVSTHHHVDHYGASGPYRQLSHAEVCLHPLEAERAASARTAVGEQPEWLRRHGVPIVPPDEQMPSPARWFGHGVFAGGARPHHCRRRRDPARRRPHAGGRVDPRAHVRALLPVAAARRRALRRRSSAAQDHAARRHLSERPENPLGDFLASHEKIQQLDARLVCPAHGGVYEDHRRRARQLIDFHQVRMRTMLELIRRPLTAYEVALGAFAISPDNRFQVMAATSETLAHLELLRLKGKVSRTETDGVVRYKSR